MNKISMIIIKNNNNIIIIIIIIIIIMVFITEHQNVISITTITSHQCPCLGVLPRIVSGGGDGGVTVWDLETEGSQPRILGTLDFTIGALACYTDINTGGAVSRGG
jgi:hypothetical protein